MISIENQRDDFITNGYCYFEDVIPPGEVERIRQSVERDVWAHNLLERPTGYVPGFLRFNQDVAPFVTREPLIFAESLFGAHVRISMVSGIVNGSGSHAERCTPTGPTTRRAQLTCLYPIRTR